MSDESLRKIWSRLQFQRHSGVAAQTPLQILELAKSNAVQLSAADFWYIASEYLRDAGTVVCPPVVANFVAALAAGEKVEGVLDPWVGCGTLLAPVVAATGAHRFVGIHPQLDAVRAAELLLAPIDRGEYLASEPTGELLDSLGPFDLIVSAPPFGMQLQRFKVADVELSDGRGHEILARSALRLRPGGCGVFVVAPRFVLDTRPGSVAANLAALGLYVDAFFHVPGGAYRPMTSIDCGVVVVRRGPSPAAMFVGEVTDDPARVGVLIENYRKRRAANSPELGALVAPPSRREVGVDAGQVSEHVEPATLGAAAEFRGFRQLVIEHRITAATKRLRLPQHRLGDLCLSIKRCGSDAASAAEVDNAFFFPLIATSVVRVSLSDLPKRLNEFALVAVDPAKADARVLAGFFDSALGREIRQSHARGATIQRIDVAALADLPVWLPDLKAQRGIVEMDQRMSSMTDELGELRGQLWRRLDQADEIGARLTRVNHEESIKEWLDSLPFPIASILWTAHALRGEAQRQYVQFDYFFEGLAEFLAIVLLSGAQRDATFLVTDWPQIRDALSKSHLTLARASFGTWITIFENLAKRVRTALSDGPDAGDDWLRRLACDDAELLKVLVSKDMVTVLQRANTLRNQWRGHGGVVGDDEARRRAAVLNELVLEVRRLVGLAWARYPVVLPGRSIFKNGLHRSTVQVASGVRHPFEQIEFELQAPMEDGVLHMVAPRAGYVCPLLPLVRLAASPSDEKNACYFFNRLDGGQLRYVSYHYEARNELHEPRGGALQVLDGLLRSS